MDVFRQCKKGYLILGGLLLIFAFVVLFKKKNWVTYTTWLLSLGILAVFVFHMYGMGMRWYIAGYAPWSNSYETMVYVAWATVFAGLLFVRKSTLTFALATLFGGIILFRVRLELDGPADQSAGSGLEIPMVDVPCGGYRGSLWFLRY